MWATRVADVTHLQGRRQNQLVGYGLVIGLPGTGDGGKYAASILQLQAMLQKFEISVPANALADTKNVAIVMLEATIPENGVREGDRIDVRVNSTGAAKSLAGGYLVATPLQGPGLDRIFAFANGQVRLPDPKVKTSGVVAQGATMEADVIHNYISENWEVTLVVEDVHASHALASVIAQVINENASEVGRSRELAVACGPKNVVVAIPEEERSNPADFIARIENTELLMPVGEARIVINRQTGTIAIGEGVEIGPAVISHKGMSIMTTQPPPEPTVERPLVKEQFALPIEAPKRNAGNAKLRELVDALNQLNVPSNEIIEIVENLHRLGKINAKLVIVE
ncbi:MAG TPA: flagellar basal body P-ring protein FlgI [Phycisphaerae bacterium]|nr:flagellar basal body P-ring protein FlgI [Phycisphaerae bacterium]